MNKFSSDDCETINLLATLRISQLSTLYEQVRTFGGTDPLYTNLRIEMKSIKDFQIRMNELFESQFIKTN